MTPMKRNMSLMDCRNDLERAYLLGFIHGQRGYSVLHAWIKRSRTVLACYQQGFGAGLDASAGRLAA